MRQKKLIRKIPSFFLVITILVIVTVFLSNKTIAASLKNIINASSSTIYKITYNENGGQVGAIGSNGMTQSFSLGKKVTLSPPSFYKTGYILLGFSKNKNSTTAEFSAGKSYSFTSNVTLYAIWKPTVSYALGGGKLYSGSQTQSFTAGVSFTLNPPILSKDGYYVDGYSTSYGSSTVVYTAGQRVTLKGSITLYPVWKKKYKAIVIFPGILGSNLYDKNKKPIYNSDVINNILSSVEKGNAGDVIFAALNLQSLVSTEAKYTGQTKGSGVNEYGIFFDGEYPYKMIIKSLRDKYINSPYEVIFYEYDWRKSCSSNAYYFNRDVASKYSKMVLIGHSMGGLVITSYLWDYGTSDTVGQSKIEKCIFVGTPFAGAPLAAYLSDGGDFAKDFLSSFDEIKKLNAVEKSALNYVMKRVFNSIDSRIDLYPCYTMINNIDSQKANLVKKYKSSYSNSNTNSWYKNSSGVWHHITNKVDSYYVVGKNLETVMGYNSSSLVKQNSGDGIVPEYSAGLFGKYSSRTYKIDCQHMDLISNSSVINYIIARINEGPKPANDTSNPIIRPIDAPHPTPKP